MEVTFTNEIWKIIKECPDYMVSNTGKIKSFKIYKDGYLLKHKIDKDGYHTVSLATQNKKLMRRVHRLVAIAFLGNKNNYPIVNHLDGNIDNNSANNLEWCTNSRNQLHRYNELCGTWDATRKGRSYTFTRIKTTDINTGQEKFFDCINDCARYYNVSDSCIHNRLHGRAKNPSDNNRSRLNHIYIQIIN